jgi:SAM-dependent methyltransferase
MSKENTAVYQPEVFSVNNLHEAQQIILTPEQGTTTEERWEKETPFVSEVIGSFLNPSNKTILVDYGCGIGRLAKELIEKYNSYVIGVDISVSMRQIAPGYVQSDRFSIISKDVFMKLVSNGMKVDCCIATWVLQHCPRVEEDISLIKTSLKTEGLFFVLNNMVPAIPTNKGWVNDGKDISAILTAEFTEMSSYKLPYSVTTKTISDNTFIMHLKKDGNSLGNMPMLDLV